MFPHLSIFLQLRIQITEDHKILFNYSIQYHLHTTRLLIIDDFNTRIVYDHQSSWSRIPLLLHFCELPNL